MEARFDGIAAFADIGEFIDQPVRTYSSGMYVRLAFAVSIASDPEIMIVDEALAVGDIGFQSKCMTAHTRLQSRGTTLLFVSHDMESLKSLCSRGVYLERGVIREIGPASRVAEHYTRRIRMEMSPERTRTESKVNATKGEVARVDKQSADSVEAMEASTEFTRRVSHFRYGEGGAGITYGELLDENLQATNSVRFDQSVHIRVHFGSSVEGDMSCNYYVMDDKKNLILGAGLTLVDRPYLQATKGGKYVVTYKTRLPLLEGNYSIQLQITTPALEGCPTRFLDVVEDAIVFHVSRRDGVRIWSKVYIENEVEISSC